MAGRKLDGAGTAKMSTLESAMAQLAQLHTVVEKYGLEVKKNGQPQHYLMQIKRLLPQLVGVLKGQFGMISDQAAAVNLSASRGSSEPIRLRGLREGVAQIRVALEIAEKQVLEKHTVHDEKEATA